MWTSILALLPTVFGWINSIIGYFSNKSAEQTSADQAEQSSEDSHEDDGAQSVAGMDSDDAQQAALDQLDQQEDNPVKITVTNKGGS